MFAQKLSTDRSVLSENVQARCGTSSRKGFLFLFLGCKVQFLVDKLDLPGAAGHFLCFNIIEIRLTVVVSGADNDLYGGKFWCKKEKVAGSLSAKCGAGSLLTRE